MRNPKYAKFALPEICFSLIACCYLPVTFEVGVPFAPVSLSVQMRFGIDLLSGSPGAAAFRKAVSAIIFSGIFQNIS